MGNDPLQTALPAAFEVILRFLNDRLPEDINSQNPTPMSDVLYRDWYCAVGEKPDVHAEDRDLFEMFRTTHAAAHRWEGGWNVAKVSKRGKVAVTRGRERRVIHVIDCLPRNGNDACIRPGDTVSVVARRDSETMNPGDYVTFSEAWHANKSPILRLYWNVAPIGALKLVNTLTCALGDTFPYFIKCPRRSPDFDRRDALVLYLPRALFAQVASDIAMAARSVRDELYNAVPPLTKRLAPGVGLAEDPETENESFGSSRCALVARGILQSIAQGYQSDAWEESVREMFATAGIPPDRPWAETAASPEYALP